MKFIMLLVAGVALSLAACADEDDAPSAQETACLDSADAFAKAAARCGLDYAEERDGFIRAAANGDCANIVMVRDEKALRNTCIPSLSTISCDDLLAINLDPTCRSQLLR